TVVPMTTRIIEQRRTTPGIISDFWFLMKPELTSLSVFSALVSAYMAVPSGKPMPLRLLLILAAGTLCAGGGAAALNQYLERLRDAAMKRTQKRPLAAGRLDPRDGLIFGIMMSIAGVAMLGAFVNLICASITAATILTYIGIYTPLKHISSVSTIVGAIPGALPVLIGWTAVQNALSLQAMSLFAIVYYWQMPHFYALAWLYRNDYSKGGFKLLSTIDTTGVKIGWHVVVNCAILLAIGCLPYALNVASVMYLAGACAAGLAFLVYGIVFARSIGDEGSQKKARRLFFASLVYLPVILVLLIIFKL
ncbi:MAG TPA: heme o synthase, partial [Bacteroidota bacterium]|nr:heme o synthase [Bacteroidota bacterium]